MPKHIEDLVIQQVRRSELAHQAAAESGEPCRHSVVTISRRMGSGARIVANKLAHELGWSLWDRELLDAIAQDGNVSRRVVEAFDERVMSGIDVIIRDMLGDHEMGAFLYPRHLAHAVAVVASLGNAIVLGRGANFLLPDALSVRIDAPDELRIRNMMSYEGLNREAAVAKLRESDRERECFLYRMFGRSKVQNTPYDLSVWMHKFNTDDAVEIVRSAIQRRCLAPSVPIGHAPGGH